MSTTPKFNSLAEAYEHIELRLEQCELTSRKRFDDLQASEAKCAELEKYSGILSDAYENQKKLTHAACASERETWAELRQWKDRFEGMRNERDEIQGRLHAIDEAYSALSSDQPYAQMARQAAAIKGYQTTVENLREEIARLNAIIKNGDDIVDASFDPEAAGAYYGFDLGEPGGDQSRIAWRCSCGTIESVDIKHCSSIHTHCDGCGKKFVFVAAKQ